jgi:uncharacterized membrane protein YhiD involved in acid resistance
VVLRPVSQAINRRSTVGTELTTTYQIELTGDGESEEASRSLLLETLRRNQLRPELLSSEDIDDSHGVNVEALVLGEGRDDAKLERVAAALQRDAAVRSVSWRVSNVDKESARSTQAAE